MAISLILAAAALGGCGVLLDRRATSREAAAEAAYPATGQQISVMGTTVHADIEGEGPDLILIHGASGNSREFTFALSRQLARDWRVIALDRPGMGWSGDIGPRDASPLVQAEVLQAAARELGVTNPVVLGHSYGGAVAMAWALTAPPGSATDPAALVIVSGATMPWPGGLAAWYTLTGTPLGGATVVPAITAFATPERTRTAIDGIFAPEAVPPGYIDHIGPALSLRRASLRANGRQVRALKPHLGAMSANYPRLTLPVEILHGTADTTVPATIHALPLSQTLPDADLTLIDGAGHMPHHTHPQAVIDAVDRAATRAGLR